MKNSRWFRIIIVIFITIGAATYYQVFVTPKHSLELYQEMAFAEEFEDVQKLMLDGYEENFKEEDFEFIKRLDTSPNRISQFTLLEYNEKSYMIMTSPGTEKLKVLAVEELPIGLREYFREWVDSL